ncbi:DUF2946 domain-containing protein [Pseudomonas matsuisoli]|uniref:DUF2946 domain-containing protein n=1 Tax=Pseudomonas matsuisoli TaxID=1515666 RepID=A0A917PQL0_9PSED|nr:DUF2946 domain-containing protein [Pseudomonas matsuisoli]GGJ87446.1 hypothetical protein GCM10009304_11590 [Pseudomonas matsuisoli]
MKTRRVPFAIQRPTAAWLALFAMVLLYAAPLISRAQHATHHVHEAVHAHMHHGADAASEHAHMHMPDTGDTSSGHAHGLCDACDYCSLLIFSPALGNPFPFMPPSAGGLSPTIVASPDALHDIPLLSSQARAPPIHLVH